MPEPRSTRLPSILRAAITLDGKLDAATPPQRIQGTEVETLSAARCRELLVAGAVDEIHLTVRPRIDGRRDASALTGPPTPDFLPSSVACRLLSMEMHGGERVLRYRVRARK